MKVLVTDEILPENQGNLLCYSWESCRPEDRLVLPMDWLVLDCIDNDLRKKTIMELICPRVS